MKTLSALITYPNYQPLPYYNVNSTKECDVTDNKPSPPNVSNHPAKDTPPMTHPADANHTHNTTATAPAEGLHHEESRRKTFVNWPHNFIDPNVLAMTGFYYVGPADTVRCHFCRVEIGRWEPEDNEVTEHQRWSQNCALLKRRETNNVPIDAERLNRTLPPITYDVCGLNSGIDIRENTISEGSFQPITAHAGAASMVSNAVTTVPTTDGYAVGAQQSMMPIVSVSTAMRPPDHPEYAIEAVRLRSYEDWPKMMKQNPQQLTDAGFFYTSKGDRVKCFSCGGGLRDWDEHDDPWEQHALWFSHCEYLKLVKGPAYIAAVLAADARRKHEEESTAKAEALSAATSAASESLAVRTIESKSSDATVVATAASTKEAEEHHHGGGGGGGSGGADKKCDLLCKICYSNEYDTAFLPCGHVTACTKCAYTVSKCPMCREPFERVVRVYLS